MPNTKVRVVGSGYTTFNYNSQPIAFLEGIEDSGQRAFSDMGQGYQFIQPLNLEDGSVARTPIEIATSSVLAGGTLNLTIRELWNQTVWNQLSGLAAANANNIVDIFSYLAQQPQYVTCSNIIKPPGGNPRGKIYHGCVVVDIADGDTVTIGALSVTKNITVAYCYSTNIGTGPAYNPTG